MSAVISPCGLYRLSLSRRIPLRHNRTLGKRGPLVWVLLNPSTADAVKPDPTLRRVMEFTKGFGYSELYIINLYSFRTAFPHELWKAEDPVGPDNDAWIYQIGTVASKVILGWGANAKPERVAEVVEILKAHNPELYCLGTNKDGSPRHPLYLKKTTPLEPWSHP